MGNKRFDPAQGLNAAVAAELRAELAAHTGWTQKTLSETSGIPKVSVQRYLQPKRHLDLETLEVLCAALGRTAKSVMVAAIERMDRHNDDVRAEADANLTDDDRAPIEAQRSRAAGKRNVKPTVANT